MKKFEAPVVIKIPLEIIDGIEMHNVATLDVVIINYKTKQIALQWSVESFNVTGTLLSIIPKYTKEQIALESIFIAPDGTTVAWNESELLNLFGVKDENGNQTYDEDSIPILTRTDLMDGWSFYMKKSTQPIPLQALFIAAGNRAANEGRLNRN